MCAKLTVMLIYGRNAVIEAIKEDSVHQVWAAVGVERRLLKILSALGVHPLMVPRIELDQMVKTTHHQGVVAVLESPMFQDPEAPFTLAQQRGEPLLLVLLDGVTDPGNYGAIIRSAEALGAHGVVSETRRSAPLSAVTIKASAGAAHHLPLVQVVNLPRHIEWLKSRGVWVYGTASEVDRPIWTLNVPLLLVLLDGVTDPGNYGAIIRSAEALGAHGVVSETRRSAPLSAVTIKASAGAAHHLPLVQVVNLPRHIEWLKSRGVWVYGTASEVDRPIWTLDFQRPVAVVLGSEGRGLRRLVREHCDELGRIPLYGQIGSLNVASALAVVLYQAARWREG